MRNYGYGYGQNLPVRDRVTKHILGPELVVNGAFNADTNWTRGTNWTISGGLARKIANPSAQGVRQTIAFKPNTLYLVSFDVIDISVGSIRARLSSGTTEVSAYANRTTPGNYSEIMQSDANTTNIFIVGTAATVCNIDNVSVREVLGRSD